MKNTGGTLHCNVLLYRNGCAMETYRIAYRRHTKNVAYCVPKVQRKRSVLLTKGEKQTASYSIPIKIIRITKRRISAFFCLHPVKMLLFAG